MPDPEPAEEEQGMSFEDIDLDSLDNDQLKSLIYRQHDAIEQLATQRSKEGAEFIEFQLEGIGMFKINSPAANDSMELIDKVVDVIKDLKLSKSGTTHTGSMI